MGLSALVLGKHVETPQGKQYAALLKLQPQNKHKFPESPDNTFGSIVFLF